MLDDIEWDPIAALIALGLFVITILSAFSSGWGWDSFPLSLKIPIIASSPFVGYFVALYLIQRG